MGDVYGYLRVSSADQNVARQYIAMKERGIDARHIFMDKQSGKDFDRPRYGALLRRLRPGDLLCVTRIDRLGRNYDEVREQWRELTREKRVDILVLDMPMLDTRRDKDLLGTFIADLVLQVLSFAAQNERENIRRRQAEGIAAARARGVRFGRAAKSLPENFGAMVQLWRKGDISGSQAARNCGMPLSTFRYKAARYEGSRGSENKKNL